MEYKEAFNLLVNKCGKRIVNHTLQKGTESKVKNYTVPNYSYNIPEPTSDLYVLHLLITQYYYGYAPQKELANLNVENFK